MEKSTEFNINGHKVTLESKVEFKDNPKRPRSAAHERYSKYAKAKTFGEYLKLNDGKFALPDARYDLGKGYLILK